MTDPASPWLNAKEAAGYARIGLRLLYRAIHGGHLQAARVGGRREVRLRKSDIDSWLRQGGTDAQSTTHAG
jgi:excisionase family DNA binding protein